MTDASFMQARQLATPTTVHPGRSNAARLVEKGCHVHPLKLGSKLPATENGLKDAAPTALTIKSNYGVHAGRSGLVMVDLDDYVTDSQTSAFETDFELPPTFTVRTGSGGRSLWYKAPEGITLTNLQGVAGYRGVDLRAGEGYALGPGCKLHPDNIKAGGTGDGVYRFEGDITEFEPLPAKLIERLTAERATPAALAVPADVRPAWNDATLEGIAADLRAAHAWPEGHGEGGFAGWEDLCARKAFRLACMVRDGQVDSIAAHAIYQDNAPTSSTFDPMVKWGPALEAAYAKPEFKAAAVAGDPTDPFDPAFDASAYTPRAALRIVKDVEPAEVESTVEATRQRFPILNWHELFATEDDGLEWILEPLLPARRMIALYSAPKVGKSLLLLEIAVGIARGGYVLGTQLKQPRRVLYVDFENDPRGDVKQRLQAMGFGPDDLTNLAYLSYPTMAKMDTMAGGQDLLRAVEAYDAELVVIDTLSRAVAGEENSNDTWLNFYKHTGLALKQRGVSCIRLDHSGKDEAQGMRGGSAKSGDVDAVWRLSTVVKDETYKLECTDNRFPVAEKVLTLHRESDPLRHRVDADGELGAYKAEIDELIRLMDEAGIPLKDGRDAVRDALGDTVKASNARLASAMKRRRELAKTSDDPFGS